MPGNTFDCGIYLPGFGPFNFEDFIGGGVIDGGDDPDDFPGPIIDIDVPGPVEPPIPGIGPTGRPGGPGGGGPGPPSPPAPPDQPVGGGASSKCRIKEFITFSPSPPPDATELIVEHRASQECIDPGNALFAGIDAHNQAKIREVKDKCKNQPPGGSTSPWRFVSSDGGENSGGGCGPQTSCGEVIVRCRYEREVDSGGVPGPLQDPGSPGPTPTGGGGPGSPPAGDTPAGSCKCLPTGQVTRTETTSGNFTIINLIFEQKCTYQGPNATAGAGQAFINSRIAQETAGRKNCRVASSSGQTDTDCGVNNFCTGTCNPYKVTIRCENEPGGGPGFSGGGPSEIPPDSGLNSSPAGGDGTQLNVTSPGNNLTQAIVDVGANKKEINLRDPQVVRVINKTNPAGLQDEEVFIDLQARNLEPERKNNRSSGLFKKSMDSNLKYLLENSQGISNWDSTKVGGLTIKAVQDSLTEHAWNLVKSIKNYDGSLLSDKQIMALIGSRIIDGTISNISISYLQKLVDSTKKFEHISINRNPSQEVNEAAAISLIQRNKFSLLPENSDGVMNLILKNWKTISSDIDKYIPIMVDGEKQRHYINDDDTFVGRSSLGLQDGDYFNLTVDGETVRIFAESEKDHAYLVPERVRQQVIELLGGNTGRTLSASVTSDNSPELNYSLSAPRQNFYVLSANLDTLTTTQNESSPTLLKNTKVKYELMETSSAAGLDAVNEFIKYKSNFKIFMLDDQDLLLDYIENETGLFLEQTDIVFDAPKENKDIPLLTKQIPWYIMVIPTNRPDYNIFNAKSRIQSINSSTEITRSLRCKSTIAPELSPENLNKFIKTSLVGKDAVDVLGNPNPQTRINKIDPSDESFNQLYIDNNNNYQAPEAYSPDRDKTSFRVLNEIITELDTNYLLGFNGVGKSITEFDAISRLTLKQFNKLRISEGYNKILNKLRDGLVNEVKLIPAIKYSDQNISVYKTQLVQRKKDAPEDTFIPYKATKSGQTIIPPTTTESARRGAYSR
jgi:hypothetical protein